MRWVDALKEWNAKRDGKYLIPKKDSAEYLEVKALMEADDPRSKDPLYTTKATKPVGLIGPASDARRRRSESPKERLAARSLEDRFKLTTSAVEHASSYKPVAAAAGAGAGTSNEMFIQEAVAKMKKGALTAQAKKHGKEPLEFAADVLADPKSYTETTRKRAQFLMNIQKKTS